MNSPRIDGRIKLKWVFKKYIVKVWTKFVWLKIGAQWQAIVPTAMNLQISWNVGNFLTVWATEDFSRVTILQEVTLLITISTVVLSERSKGTRKTQADTYWGSAELRDLECPVSLDPPVHISRCKLLLSEAEDDFICLVVEQWQKAGNKTGQVSNNCSSLQDDS